MATYLTVDGGTTNTRISLVREGRVCDVQRLSVGARDGNAALKAALREGIAQILSRNACTERDVLRILASGMITSEYGLCDLPHIHVPAGRVELTKALFETVIDEVSTVPFCFIRGVRAVGDGPDGTDMMRGEETELMGLLAQGESDTLYILPGSHSKHIEVDGKGRIAAFRTMMTGELLAAVMEHTILRDAADFAHNTLVEDRLLEGYSYCEQHGFNETIFKTRVLRNAFGAAKEECYSFLLGAVLCDEVKAVLRAPQERIVLGGQKQLREAMGILLRAKCQKSVTVLDDAAVAGSTALGAVRIYEDK